MTFFVEWAIINTLLFMVALSFFIYHPDSGKKSILRLIVTGLFLYIGNGIGHDAAVLESDDWNVKKF